MSVGLGGLMRLVVVASLVVGASSVFPGVSAAQRDYCYAFPRAKFTHQIRNVEFKVLGFNWIANASARQSDSLGDTSFARVVGTGGTLVGYQHGGYIESHYNPTNAGGYTHLPDACQSHDGGGYDNGGFRVSGHVPFTLNGTWAIPPISLAHARTPIGCSTRRSRAGSLVTAQRSRLRFVTTHSRTGAARAATRAVSLPTTI